MEPVEGMPYRSRAVHRSEPCSPHIGALPELAGSPLCRLRLQCRRQRLLRRRQRLLRRQLVPPTSRRLGRSHGFLWRRGHHKLNGRRGQNCYEPPKLPPVPPMPQPALPTSHRLCRRHGLLRHRGRRKSSPARTSLLCGQG
jgi:hypothetical protein